MRPIAATSAASGDKIHREKKNELYQEDYGLKDRGRELMRGGAGSVCPGPGPVLSESAVSV